MAGYSMLEAEDLEEVLELLQGPSAFIRMASGSNDRNLQDNVHARSVVVHCLESKLSG
ncbi:MAG: hypothetical protein ABI863_20015 [Ginsengibacter sp.]